MASRSLDRRKWPKCCAKFIFFSDGKVFVRYVRIWDRFEIFNTSCCGLGSFRRMLQGSDYIEPHFWRILRTWHVLRSHRWCHYSHPQSFPPVVGAFSCNWPLKELCVNLSQIHNLNNNPAMSLSWVAMFKYCLTQPRTAKGIFRRNCILQNLTAVAFLQKKMFLQTSFWSPYHRGAKLSIVQYEQKEWLKRSKKNRDYR